MKDPVIVLRLKTWNQKIGNQALIHLAYPMATIFFAVTSITQSTYIRRKVRLEVAILCIVNYVLYASGIKKAVGSPILNANLSMPMTVLVSEPEIAVREMDENQATNTLLKGMRLEERNIRTWN